MEDYVCDSVSISSYQLAYTTFDGENTLDDGRSWYTETYNEDGYFADASTTYSDYNDISLTGAYPSDYDSDTTSSSTTSTISKLSSSSSTLSSSSTVVGAPASSSTSGLLHLDESQRASTPVGAIVGGTIGGIALIALIAAGAFILKRKYPRKDSDSSMSNPPLTHAPGPIHGGGSGASEMDAAVNSVPMQQHEFYKPQTPQQSYNPASAHQYQAIPTSEIPVVSEPYYPDEMFLTPGHELGRAASTGRVSMMTSNESTPTSPTPAFSQLPATIVEAPGDYEYLDPHLLNGTHDHTAHEGHPPGSPA